MSGVKRVEMAIGRDGQRWGNEGRVGNNRKRGVEGASAHAKG